MKKAILVASFGTSYEETRQKNIVELEKKIADKFSDYKIYSAYTSKFIKKKLEGRGLVIDDVTEAMNRMKNDGITDIIILPTHLLYGIEYDLVCTQASEFEKEFDSIKIAKTLLNGVDAVKKTLHILNEHNVLDKDEALVLMGHGSEHHANMVYPAMNYITQTEQLNHIFVCTVEGYPEISDIIPSLKSMSFKKALLTPLMLVAGDHAINDMASDEEDSLKSILEENNIEVRCLIKGLGEYDAIKEMYYNNILEQIEG